MISQQVIGVSQVVCQFVVFRSAKERPFAERKATTWQTDPTPKKRTLSTGQKLGRAFLWGKFTYYDSSPLLPISVKARRTCAGRGAAGRLGLHACHGLAPLRG